MKEIHISLHQDSPEINEPIHACIGYFDGIHIGHRQLIQAVVKHAKEQGGAAALITFDPDPWAVIKGLTQIAHLTSMEQRKQIAAQLRLFAAMIFIMHITARAIHNRCRHKIALRYRSLNRYKMKHKKSAQRELNNVSRKGKSKKQMNYYHVRIQ